MVNENQNIRLTLTQQLTLQKLQTRLDALKVQRDETLQEFNEFLQLCSMELNIPKGSVFDNKSMRFVLPQTEPKQTPEQ